MSYSLGWRVSLSLTILLLTILYLSTLLYDDNRLLLSSYPTSAKYDGTSVFRDEVVACRSPLGLEHHDDQTTAVHELQVEEDESSSARSCTHCPLHLANASQPYAGSYHELGLEHTWTTAQDRYGPFGFGHSNTSDPLNVDWDKIDWAELQNECLEKNVLPGQSFQSVSANRKMRPPPWTAQHHWWWSKSIDARPKNTTGRTAIILRGWEAFRCHDQDFWNIRSLITETALRSGGRYSVYLLVDVDGKHKIMSDEKHYQDILETIPTEFRNMTILFDREHFLKAWYPKVLEHRPEFQIEQPRQLFAHHFPEFDNYWQIELDVRFTGDAGRLLKALESFARKEPRKQARERSSYFLIPQVYGTYHNLTQQVDAAVQGGSDFWNGVKIPDIKQIGPEPPVSDPRADHYEWGVGEEADLILLGGSMNITMDNGWVYRDWIYNFIDGQATPRITSAPAMSRCSWNLLNAIHHAQLHQGLRIPSEATPVSFAVWHNMKISRPPLPIYGEFAHLYTPEQIDLHLNGGPPSSEHDGMAWGVNAYGHGKQYEQHAGVKDLGPTWRWNEGYPGKLMEAWLSNDVERVSKEDTDVPTLVVRNGKVLMPNLMLHPVKTNKNP